MFALPDAPDIASCLRTGYPSPPRKHFCARCGDPAQVYGDTSGYLCRSCAVDEFFALTEDEQLDLLGFEALDG